VVVVSSKVKDILVSGGIAPDNISVITNGVNLQVFSSDNKEKTEFNFKWKEKFIVCYIGTLAHQYGLDNIIETAELLKDQNDILFLLVGEGPQKSEIKSRVIQNSLKNVKILDAVPISEVRQLYMQSDVALIPLKDIPLLKSTIPVKLLESMAMELPVIINAEGISKEIVLDSKGGLYVKPGSPLELKEKILYLYNNPNIRKEMGAHGRQYIEQKFDREKLADQYLELINSIYKMRKQAS
jgi:glycosyltransferase involved in cell wall biosynthesis